MYCIIPISYDSLHKLPAAVLLLEAVIASPYLCILQSENLFCHVILETNEALHQSGFYKVIIVMITILI